MIPIANEESQTVAKAKLKKKKIMLTYSVMKIFEKLSQFLDFKHDFSTAYRHQTVGTVERNHGVLNAHLRTFLIDNREDWDIYARYFEFCHNTTQNAVTEYTPFELVFGRKANMPIEKLSIIEPIYNMNDYVNELQNPNTMKKQMKLT